MYSCVLLKSQCFDFWCFLDGSISIPSMKSSYSTSSTCSIFVSYSDLKFRGWYWVSYIFLLDTKIWNSITILALILGSFENALWDFLRGRVYPPGFVLDNKNLLFVFVFMTIILSISLVASLGNANIFFSLKIINFQLHFHICIALTKIIFFSLTQHFTIKSLLNSEPIKPWLMKFIFD